MTKFSKVSLDITEHKPKMKPFYIAKPEDLRAIPFTPNRTTVQVKADGEFSLIHIDRNEIYAVNRFKRKTTDLPALKELHMLFLKTDLASADLLAELYAKDINGYPLPLPKFIHYLKGEDASLQDRIYIGLFDFVKLTAIRYTDDIDTTVGRENIPDSKTRFNMLKVFNGKLCNVLEYVVPENQADIEWFWKLQVEDEGWEGLVIRTNGDTYKAKPNRDIDAVIIGVNKNNKGYQKGLAKSVKVALMPTEGSFVELGDATIPSEAEARELYALTHVKVNEDANTAFVKPLAVVTISYISLFPDTINTIYKLLLGGFTEVGTMKAVRMKSPRVTGYRKDKQACTADVGMNQIAE